MKRSTKAWLGIPPVRMEGLQCAIDSASPRRSRYSGKSYHKPKISKLKGAISDKQLRETFENFLDYEEETEMDQQESEEREDFVKGILAESGVSKVSLILPKNRPSALRLLEYFRPLSKLN